MERRRFTPLRRSSRPSITSTQLCKARTMSNGKVAKPAFPNCNRPLDFQGGTTIKPIHNLPASTRTQIKSEITPDLQNAIRLRALELYEQRGRKNGHHLDDWLQAEAELTQRRTKMVAA